MTSTENPTIVTCCDCDSRTTDIIDETCDTCHEQRIDEAEADTSARERFREDDAFITVGGAR